MSDCSDSATKQKAINLHECIDCEHYCMKRNECSAGHVADHQDCMFLCWKERTDTIEQRYEKLAQIVKEIYDIVIQHNRSDEGQECGGIGIEDLIDQAEELGVSVDG